MGSQVGYLNRAPLGAQNCAGLRFEQIIGNSPALEHALAEVERVAPADSTVLILGETGTGKELVARAIHNISPRSGRPFLKLNCAAIPLELLESELFGHERGAFTGAVAQKKGRFEQADAGTLFLDEIGDLPLVLQPKLLRVLQDQEFERLGSGQTHRVNVRLVAATHRDLTEMVKQNEFRSDLYYRLNVFPIILPPLRERRQDIPQLVSHFVQMYCRRVGKHIEHIPEETLDAFNSYAWPGNVRELQNLIERAVIRSNNGVLSNPLPEPDKSTPLSSSQQDIARDSERAPLPAASPVTPIPLLGTLRDSERSLILRTLQATDWINGGAYGAAARLGLKRTTLIAKMKKLGISRPICQDNANRAGGDWKPGQALQAAE